MATPRRLLVLLTLTALALIVALAIQLPGAVAVPTGRVDGWPREYVYDAFLGLVLPLSALYIGTCLWGDEVENGTLVYVITRPIARPTVLLAKFVAAWVVVTAILFGGIAATALGLGTLRGTGPGGLWACATVLPMASASWLALATLCGTLLRRSLLLGLFLGAVLELLLGNLDAVARVLALSHHIGSAVLATGAYAELDAADFVTGEPVAPWVAWVTLASVAAGALTLACLQVRYKEYAPTRSD